MKWRIGCLMMVVGILGSYAQGAITQTNDSPLSIESLTASATSLIKNGSATYLSMEASDPATIYGAGGVTKLNDGVLSRNFDGQALCETDYTVTFNLNISVNTRGYNISSVRTIAYWGDARKYQKYELLVKTVGSASFTSLGMFEYLSGAANNTTVVVLTGGNNQSIAAEVEAIQFRFSPIPGSAGTPYSEIELEGTPAPGGIATGIVATKYSPLSFEELVTSSTSLIKTGSATYLGTAPTDPATAYGAGGVSFLNDGVLSRSFGEQALCEQEYWIRYDLNTSVNTSGYDISSVRTIAFWGDGRKYQKYQLYYRVVGSEEFVSLGTFEYTSGAANGTTVMVISDPNVHLLAKNVNGILFRLFPIPGFGGTTYSDIEVEGRPTLAKVTQAPVFSPDTKNVYGPMPVTITSGTAGAAIYYTINGAVPTTSSTRYTGPVTVYNGDILQAIAVGTDTSNVTCRTFAFNPARAQLDRGHNRLLEAGLQIQGLVFPVKEDNQQVTGFNLARYLSANFTAVNLWANPNAISYLGVAPGVAWGRVASAGYIQAAEEPYLSKMVTLQYVDEQNIADSAGLAAITNWISYMKTHYPDVLVYTNQYGNQQTVAEMQNYMATAQPDLVMFDVYPFNGNVTGGSPTDFYVYMQKYRLLGLAGNDGTGTHPIPYAFFTQTYVNNGHTPSESEIRLNNFIGWTFGYTYACAHIYDSNASDMSLTPVMFSGIDDNSPTAKFNEVAETNHQGVNLGPALVRLLSTDVRMVMGRYGSGTTNTVPSGITTGISGADAYLTDVSATNIGSKNNGLPGDIVIGFFKVLHESFDGDTYSNQKYFMVTNGLSDGNGTAAQTQQTIRLTFNFGSSEINSLKRLNRNTGAVEVVSLVSDGGGVYHLDLTLDGGTGDLFMYNTGAPFVGVEGLAAPALAVSPATQNVAKEAGTASFTVSNSGTGTMAWTAQVTSGNAWLTITSGTSGTNSGTIVVSFTKNTVPQVSRTATIQITAVGAAGSPCTVTVVQAAPALIPGDANKDGMVDVGDLGILAANYGGADKSWGQGDFNGDTLVDVGDLGILAAHYGEGSSASQDFSADYAKAFGTAADETDKEVGSSICSGLGLPLIAGLALMGLMLVKIEE